jgi:hypothetical protein
MRKVMATDSAGGSRLPEDVFKVKVIRLQEKDLEWEGKVRDGIEITFQVVDDPDYEGEEISGVATYPERMGKKSKLRKWAGAILAAEIAEGYALDPEDLIGKTCRIATIKKGDFTNIKDVLAYRPRPAKTGTDDDRF